MAGALTHHPITEMFLPIITFDPYKYNLGKVKHPYLFGDAFHATQHIK